MNAVIQFILPALALSAAVGIGLWLRRRDGIPVSIGEALGYGGILAVAIVIVFVVTLASGAETLVGGALIAICVGALEVYRWSSRRNGWGLPVGLALVASGLYVLIRYV